MTTTSAPSSSQEARSPERFEIEVFRPGRFQPMAGDPISFSASDLSSIAAAYDAENHPAPIVVGHPSTDAPAFGWAESFRYDGEAERMVAVVSDVEPAFAEAVRAKRYRKVSIALFSPSAPANPKPGAFYPKHIGFLGGAAPAVPGLKPVQFATSAEETVEIEFADPGFRDTASLFRRLREFIIETFGKESADEVMPSYEIDWLERNADVPSSPAYAAPTNPQPPTEPQEPPVSGANPTQPAQDAVFAEREADLKRREERLAAQERARRHGEHVAFAESLIGEGRLLPAKKDEAVALLDAVAAETLSEIAFSVDGRETRVQPIETLKSLLQAAPKVVDFDRQDMSGDPETGSTSFAAPEGHVADPAGLALHNKAAEYQRSHPGTAWLDAVRAVS